MNTDREQLELAAKAAGYAITWKTGHCKGGAFEAAFIGDAPWNPATDAGDRYRLAKALNMAIEFDEHTVSATMPSGVLEWITWGNDSYRRCKTDADAIVALAAEIGRQMP
jgi:hypothetical protein